MTLAVAYDNPRIGPAKQGGSPPRIDWVKRTGVLAFDSSYPNTGGTVGEPLTAAMLGLDEILFVEIPTCSGLVFQYDYTNSVVHVYRGDYDNASDGPLVELPNATDLSTLGAHVHFSVIGRVDQY